MVRSVGGKDACNFNNLLCWGNEVRCISRLWVLFSRRLNHSPIQRVASPAPTHVPFTAASRRQLVRRSRQLWATSGNSIVSSKQASPVYSGNPALRSPSIASFAFVCPPRATHADIVKAGSISSKRATASRASAARPRWAKADARHQ